MKTNTWCPALPRLCFGCVLLAGCDDAASGGADTAAAGDTAATVADDGSTGSSEGSDGTGGTAGEALEIAGVWIETFPDGGGTQTHTITEQTWTMASDFGSSVHHVEAWDAEARALVAQSDEANAFNAGLWGKLEWQWVDGTLHYCQSSYDAATAEAAWDAPGAEPTDLDAGCGGFPWSALQPG